MNTLDQVQPTITRKLCDRYSLLTLLDRRSASLVWKAYDHKHCEDVVVKCLPENLRDDAFHADSLRESFRLLKMLRHPHIGSIYDLDEDQLIGTFLVMKFVEGINLAQATQRRSPDPYTVLEACRILYPIAEALDYAHGEGILHRDVKPSNIMLPDDGRGAQLIDFGTASAAVRDSSAKASSLIQGTNGYVSPEVAEGEAAVAQSDQFSLAVVAYEMISGELPFVAAPGEGRLTLRSNSTVSALNVPVQVNAVFKRALTSIPVERFSKCTDFISALRVAESEHLLGNRQRDNQQRDNQKFTKGLSGEWLSAKWLSGKWLVDKSSALYSIARVQLPVKTSWPQFKSSCERRVAVVQNVSRKHAKRLKRRIRAAVVGLLLPMLLVLLVAKPLALFFAPLQLAKVQAESQAITPHESVISRGAIAEPAVAAVTDDPSGLEVQLTKMENQTRTLLEQNQGELAKQTIRTAVNLAPKRCESWKLLGMAHASLGEHHEAVAAFNHAVSLSPDNLVLRSLRGQSLHSAGQFQRAIKDLDVYLSQVSDVNCLESRGYCHAQERNYAKAIADFQDAMKLDPTRGFLEQWIRSCQQNLKAASQFGLIIE